MDTNVLILSIVGLVIAVTCISVGAWHLRRKSNGSYSLKKPLATVSEVFRQEEPNLDGFLDAAEKLKIFQEEEIEA